MSDLAEAPGLIDRALRRVAALWRDMAGSAPAADDIVEQMRACLEARGGEVSARARAAGLAQAYLAADHAGRGEFLRSLAAFDSDHDAVRRAWDKVAEATGVAERAAAQARLRRALEPPRLRLLTQFTAIPDGVKFVVDLRAELLARMKGDPMLEALEGDLRTLLAAWFDVGFLELRQIDWSSPAALLEKLVQYEAVHRIRGWRDLKNRLESDRRCYAFFHPRMPEEPLIFVEVALVKGMADNVQRLLDEKAPVLDPREADTAIFYSINNCQRGLDGISFGNFLIKRVVGLLAEEFRNIKTYCTLSPIPGFRRWLDAVLTAEESPLTEEERKTLRGIAILLPETVPTEASEEEILRALIARRGVLRVEEAQRALEPIMARLCARYLVREDAKGRPGRARDPVAHFHLSNGARAEKLNWRGDTSENGHRQSVGMMVNYLYDPDRIEENHELYVGEGRRAVSTALRKLARG